MSRLHAFAWLLVALPLAATATASANTASEAPAAKPSQAGCPLNASQLGALLGVGVRRDVPGVGVNEANKQPKRACTFVPVTACPCGAAQYDELQVAVLIGLPASVRSLRVAYTSKPAGEVASSRVVSRPDLGASAFELRARPGADWAVRGITAVFPSRQGTVIVLVALGFQTAATRSLAGKDAHVAEAIISRAAHGIG